MNGYKCHALQDGRIKSASTGMRFFGFFLIVFSITFFPEEESHAATISGNLLQDSGFNSGSNALQPFFRPPAGGNPYIPGEWNAEDAHLIVGSDSGISPAEGDGMIRVNGTSLALSQVNQIIDVTSFTADIVTGNVVADFQIFVNAPEAGVTGGLVLSSGPGRSASVGTLVPRTVLENVLIEPDDVLGTWELFTGSVLLPENTQFLELEFNALNSSIPVNGVFFDDSMLTLRSTVPVPGSVWMLLGGMCFFAQARKRYMKSGT